MKELKFTFMISRFEQRHVWIALLVHGDVARTRSQFGAVFDDDWRSLTSGWLRRFQGIGSESLRAAVGRWSLEESRFLLEACASRPASILFRHAPNANAVKPAPGLRTAF